MSLIEKTLEKVRSSTEFICDVWGVLTQEERRHLLKSAAVLSLSNFLDLIGIFLVGALGVLGISLTGLGEESKNGLLENFMRFARINVYSIEQQISILAVAAVMLFIMRTTFSMHFVRRTYTYLGKVASRLSRSLMEQDFNKTVDKLESENSQQLLYRSIYGVDAIAFGVLASIVTLVSDFVLLTAIGCSLLVINSKVTIFTFIYLSLVAFFLYRSIGPKTFSYGAKRADLSIELNKHYFTALSTFREISVRNRRKYLLENLGQIRESQTRILSQVAFLPLIGKFVIEGTFVLGIMLLSFYQFMISNPENALGTLVVFLAAGSRIAPAILRIQNGLLTYRNSTGAALVTVSSLKSLGKVNRCVTSRNEEPEQASSSFIPSIECKQIGFTYDGQTRPIIANLSLVVEPGDFVAIVGPSGIGKSTLVDLMLGLLEPTSGEVLISGVKPRKAIEMWEGEITYVPQVIALTDGSIRDNLNYSYPSDTFTDEDMIYSLHFSRLDSFVLGQVDGLDMQIGENGNKLSGGQRQRLVLSKSMMKKPKIVFLDEATSALDAESESVINDSLKKLKSESTIISIVHKLATLELASKIVYMTETGIEVSESLSQFVSKHPDLYSQLLNPLTQD